MKGKGEIAGSGQAVGGFTNLSPLNWNAGCFEQAKMWAEVQAEMQAEMQAGIQAKMQDGVYAGGYHGEQEENGSSLRWECGWRGGQRGRL